MNIPYFSYEKAGIIMHSYLAHYLIEMHFNAFANRADPDQAALVRAA